MPPQEDPCVDVPQDGDIHFDHQLKELGMQAELLGHWLLQYSISYEESVSIFSQWGVLKDTETPLQRMLIQW